MSYGLKRVNLMLHEDLHERLKLEAGKTNTSVSELVRRALKKSLGMSESPREVVERIRRLRDVIGPMPDSTATVRRSRDRR